MGKMNGTMNLFIVFMAIFVIAFFAIGFTSTIVEPDDATTAGMQYNNLTNATAIADTGLQGTMLLVIIGMVLTAMYAAFSVNRR